MFENDNDALTILNRHGIEEIGNGFLEANWETLSEECKTAIQYLCDEWDFSFKDLSCKAELPHMKCCICDKTIPEINILYRVNAKGSKAIHVCENHVNNADVKIDPEIKRLCEALTK